MSKVNNLISFLKQIPYTERKTIDSCPYMSLESDIVDEYYIRVEEEGTTNYFNIEVETEYFAGGDRDEFGQSEVERREITEVTDINYFNEDADMIKIEDATEEQLDIIYSELPINY
jgi:hypothetical protein